MVRHGDFHVRLSDEEELDLAGKSSRLGLSKAALIRFYISVPIEYTDRLLSSSDPIVAVDRRAVLDLVRQVRAWGYHYDGCLHALNVIAAKRFMRPDEAEALMRRAVEKLVAIDATRGVLEATAEALLESPRARFERGRG